MPANPQLAVELYAEAVDIPFLKLNNEVRVTFDGYPVLQVSGWPNIAIGTFKGRVAVIDKVASKEGKFRYLVLQDSTEKWPAILSQGSGVYGFTLLGSVPVWFEVWRKLNGFPPNLTSEEGFEVEEKKSDLKLKIK
jgi:hypothetical protein